MAGDFSCKPNCYAAGTIKQRERQARRQLAWLFKRAVIVGNKVHRTLVQLFEQQAGDAGKARFGIAHGSSAVAVTAAKIALAVNQGVPLRKILRHAHHGVVCGTVAVRVIFAQHITHHPGAFDRFGPAGAIGPAKAQTHARHAVQNTPLYRLLAIARIRKGPALDNAKRVFKVRTLGIGAKRILIGGFWGSRCSVGNKQIHKK